MLRALLTQASPLDLRIVGRTLVHAALIGAAAGVVAVLFFGGLEIVESLLLGRLVGYTRLRAYGGTVLGAEPMPEAFRPWLLLIVGLLDENDITRAYLTGTACPDHTPLPVPRPPPGPSAARQERRRVLPDARPPRCGGCASGANLGRCAPAPNARRYLRGACGTCGTRVRGRRPRQR
jgi:hypothetical protein